MKSTLVRLATGALVAAQISACGVILHPERVDQPRGGRIDPAIAILDGIGCLFFLIPGLVAFAVDFHEGTIYLPRGETASGGWRPVARADRLTREAIEQAVATHTGTEVALDDPRLEAWRMESITDLSTAGMH